LASKKPFSVEKGRREGCLGGVVFSDFCTLLGAKCLSQTVCGAPWEECAAVSEKANRFSDLAAACLLPTLAAMKLRQGWGTPQVLC
jgi:hypothetical protein